MTTATITITPTTTCANMTSHASKTTAITVLTIGTFAVTTVIIVGLLTIMNYYAL